MRVAIIGAGRLGAAIGSRLAEAGHDVVYAGGESARRAAGSHPRATAADNATASRDADVVVLAVPFAKVGEALGECGALDGKLVWSCVNALKPDASGLTVGFDDSAAEEVRRHAPRARVVAALPPFADLIASGETDFGGQRPTSWVCGGDAGDKATVGALLRDIGADPSDAGPLEASRLAEPAAMLIVAQTYSSQPPRTLALRLLER